MPGVPVAADVGPVRLRVDAGEPVVDDQPAAVAALHPVVEPGPQVPDVAGRHPVVGVDVGAQHGAVAVDLDPRVRGVVARARVAHEHAAERAADAVAALEHLAGHDLGAGVRREDRDRRLGIAPVDAVEVVEQDLLHCAHVVHEPDSTRSAARFANRSFD